MNYFKRVKHQFINFIFCALCGGTSYGLVILLGYDGTIRPMTIPYIIGTSVSFILLWPFILPDIFFGED
jgi:hypothetical protein